MDWHKKQLGNESRKFSKEQLEDIIILRYKDKLSYQKIRHITSHWQNGRLSAKLKVSAFYSAECVPHSAFFNNLASVETHRLRHC